MYFLHSVPYLCNLERLIYHDFEKCYLRNQVDECYNRSVIDQKSYYFSRDTYVIIVEKWNSNKVINVRR
ncbi:hypothetical protein SAMN05444416_11619 [Thermoactinomyces sp. DSM 45892]|nr:hypothetical protein SAMN05444416_11619 [Thermoactinomyces sp. DSM 45892]